MLTQRPAVRRLLPLEIEDTDEPSPSGPLPQYEWEPSPEEVLDALLPQFVAARIFFAHARVGRLRAGLAGGGP